MFLTKSDVWRNGGEVRMHAVDKMDTEANSQKENWKFGKRWAWRGLVGVENIMVLNGG